jgi:hypothetical protein
MEIRSHDMGAAGLQTSFRLHCRYLQTAAHFELQRPFRIRWSSLDARVSDTEILFLLGAPMFYLPVVFSERAYTRFVERFRRHLDFRQNTASGLSPAFARPRCPLKRANIDVS